MAEQNKQSGNDRDEIKHQMDELKGDMSKIQQDLRTLAEKALGYGRHQADETRSRVESQFSASKDQFQQYVEERPVTTVLVAFVVGMLAGKLFGRD